MVDERVGIKIKTDVEREGEIIITYNSVCKYNRVADKQFKIIMIIIIIVIIIRYIAERKIHATTPKARAEQISRIHLRG